MTVKYIPPNNPRRIHLEKLKGRISDVVEKYVTGENKSTRVDACLSELLSIIDPLLPKVEPTKGATVMTEAAASRNKETKQFLRGPSNL